MNVLIIGYKGFVGKNLFYKLKEKKIYSLFTLDKKSSEEEIRNSICKADLIFLLAGINKEILPYIQYKNNYLLTKKICSILEENNKKTRIIFTSSTQVNKNNSYGKSKLKAEKILLKYKKKNKASVIIYRLPNIFGKWSEPYYNSVVATFCFNIARNKKIIITENNKKIKLLYIDDLIEDFMKKIEQKKSNTYVKISKTYDVTLFTLANLIKSFNTKDKTYLINDVSKGFVKKLFSTYISFLPNNKFKYKLKSFSDDRGSFVEFLKNDQIGQLSYFSILPKKIRGNHFHHTKIEKFVVIAGEAKFNFVNIMNNDKFFLLANSNKNLVINSIPGWAHSIENPGKDITRILVWSNEILDKKNPDTNFYKI
jgi:UDP-2-acetamido-2,6-beta-L-arabino-hexul-4-ose reductase